MGLWVIVLSIAIVLATVALFAFVASRFARATKRFTSATHEVLPAFAEVHGLAFDPRGSPHRLARAHGLVDGVALTVELFLEHAWERDFDESRRTTVVRTRARAERDTEGSSFEAEVGDHVDGVHVTSGEASLDDAGRRAVLAFAARRRGVLRASREAVVLEWPMEDDLDALEAAARAAIVLARA